MAKEPTRDERLVLLMTHLFHDHFCPEEDVPEWKKGFVLPSYFMGWADAKMGLWSGPDLCEAAGVSCETWDEFVELVSGGVGPERVTSVWPLVTLGRRPAPRHRLKNLTWVLLLEWEDGVVFPVQIHVRADMLGGQNFTDGTVGMILASHFKQFLECVVGDGLDKLREQGRNYGGEDVFNVLMGAFLRIIPQLKPELRERLEDYARLIRGVFQPPDPREVHKAQERLRRPSGGAVGGWDA